MTMTPEERRESRRAHALAMRARPDFEAKRMAAIHAYWQNYRETGKDREKFSAKNLKVWETRRRRGKVNNGESEEQRKARSERMHRLRADPAFEQKRKAAYAKMMKTDAKARIRQAQIIKETSDRRRGFKIPAKLWKEYQFLRVTKGIPAREAGRMLGLVE